MNLLRVTLCVLACACAVRGNVYLHNPRGSNNRLNEPEAATLNNLRLFNGQNNAEGGYSWGPAMSYVEGSVLPIEWTSLLECGTDDTCTQILQYMCTDTNGAGDVIRDGQTTMLITTVTNATDPNYYNALSGDTYKYGLHESLSYYQECSTRTRNKGLFTADITVANGVGAMATRQNAGGTRYGLECVEERDYYPYWHPSPWKDIAIVTSDPTTCAFYQAESQNVKGKGHCTKPTGYASANNPTDCATQGGNWTVEPAFGLPAPDCQKATYSTTYEADTYPGLYTWKLPTAATEPCVATSSCNCVMRLRFNITSANSTGLNGNFPDSRNSGAGYVSPTNSLEYNEIGNLTLAYNTAQDGRTFQDRSFMFHIIPTPSYVQSSATIYNLNVRGKRGNNVQAFPAMEYGFTPSELVVGVGDYVHFQWTGADTYPNSPGTTKYDGHGTLTDRSNIIQIPSLKSNSPLHTVADYQSTTPLFDTPALRSYMALLGQTNCTSNYSSVSATALTNCAFLNGAGQYFDGGILRMNNSGVFTYMSTRNNDFSNRSQKGIIYVGVTPPTPTPSATTGASTTTTSKGSSTSPSSTTAPHNNSAGKETLIFAHFLLLLCISLFL